jgi:hypothetical protein
MRNQSASVEADEPDAIFAFPDKHEIPKSPTDASYDPFGDGWCGSRRGVELCYVTDPIGISNLFAACSVRAVSNSCQLAVSLVWLKD